MELGALGAAAGLAILLMPFVSLIKKSSWSTQAKQALGLIAAFIAAIGGAVIDGNVDTLAEGIAYLATARVVAETLYTQYFGGTSLNSRLESIGDENQAEV